MKNNVFRGIFYSFLSAMMLFGLVQSILFMNGSLEMTFIEFYNTIGYKGLIVIGVFLFFAINMFVFAINNYKRFVYNVADRYGNSVHKSKIFTKVYKTIISMLLFAGLIYLLSTKIKFLELIESGNVKMLVFMLLTITASAITVGFEFAELIYSIRFKNKRPRIKRNKKVEVTTRAVQAVKVEPVNNKREQPIFKFGKK